MLSLLLSRPISTFTRLPPGRRIHQDVVADVPHPFGVKFFICKLLYLLEIEQNSSVSGPEMHRACNPLSDPYRLPLYAGVNAPAPIPEIGDTMRKSEPATPERIVTCHKGITLPRAVELLPLRPHV